MKLATGSFRFTASRDYLLAKGTLCQEQLLSTNYVVSRSKFFQLVYCDTVERLQFTSDGVTSGGKDSSF
jgi:hypothetical protein